MKIRDTNHFEFVFISSIRDSHLCHPTEYRTYVFISDKFLCVGEKEISDKLQLNNLQNMVTNKEVH
jgi:hypothetical protein